MSTVKRGDTHTITLTVTSGGQPVDLTGATIRLLARRTGTSGEPTILDATVTDAAAGQLTHTLTGTLAVGPWDMETEVTRDEATTTYPTEGYARLDVQPDLG